MKKLFAFLFGIAVVLSACSDDGDDPKYLTLDFESVPTTSLAGPTSYGDNLYSFYTATSEGYDPAYERYTGYHDTKTDLKWEIYKDEGYPEATGKPEFWAGGVAVSRWADKTTTGPNNQCSVYGTGGHNGSKTFAVVFGGFTTPSAIYFNTASTEKEFEGMWVTNNTYATLFMENGDSQSPKMSYERKDWFKLTINGLDKNGTKKGSVDVYLADFREASSPGILKEWKYVDLSSLGAVHKLTFEFGGTVENNYGMSIPTYFCIDDLKFKM